MSCSDPASGAVNGAPQLAQKSPPLFAVPQCGQNRIVPSFPSSSDALFIIAGRSRRSPLIASVAAGGDVRQDGRRDAADRHGLKPNPSRSRQHGVEQSFAAEQFVLQSWNLTDLHLHARGESCDIAGVHHQLLAGLEIISDYITVDFRESDAAAAQPLHDESFATEQARAESFAEMDRQLDAHFRGEERAFCRIRS